MLLFVGLVIVQQTERIELFLEMNTVHTQFWDRMMPWITHLGTPYFTILVLLFLNQKRPKKYTLLFYAISGFILLMIITILKEYIAFPRPMSHPRVQINYTLIDGQARLLQNSYPSGHTATIFFTVTSYLIVNNFKWLGQLALLLVAVLVGYSRIYVGAHFMEDVLVGSYIGLVVPVIVYCFFYKRLDEIFSK